ncbi:hypothetical protein AQ490_23045 [Wenjunlia vitaminophila]|uniref:Uncharacterized protein n=1 Tax=Wenjunlia vitaminophila TaxID=76728 RepID=A0A0T6LS80_WENVI|nr:hypothetical protein AQ490_23045 [Wenjunlia vitaminophila]
MVLLLDTGSLAAVRLVVFRVVRRLLGVGVRPSSFFHTYRLFAAECKTNGARGERVFDWCRCRRDADEA